MQTSKLNKKQKHFLELLNSLKDLSKMDISEEDLDELLELADLSKDNIMVASAMVIIEELKGVTLHIPSVSEINNRSKRLNNLTNGKPRNHGLPWDDNCNELLLHYFNQGLSLADQAYGMERTKASVCGQLDKLNAIYSTVDRGCYIKKDGSVFARFSDLRE